MPHSYHKCDTNNPDTQNLCGEYATSLQPSKDISVTKPLKRMLGSLGDLIRWERWVHRRTWERCKDIWL